MLYNSRIDLSNGVEIVFDYETEHLCLQSFEGPCKLNIDLPFSLKEAKNLSQHLQMYIDYLEERGNLDDE